MQRTGRSTIAAVGLAVALMTGGTLAQAAGPAEEFIASSGLFELAVPAGWVATEHADGGGVSLDPGTDGVSLNVTFIPRAVLDSGGLSMAAPAGAGPMAIAERIAILVPPAEGIEAAAPALIDLDSGAQAVELSAAGAEIEGALYILEPAPGVTTLASATVPSGGYADARAQTLEILSSLVFSGDEAALMDLLGPPPLVDIALG